MIYKMFTVYDSKANAYLQPFFLKSAGEAVRAFTDSCNDPKTAFCRHPEDFTLFEIGTYDDSTALVETHKAHISLGLASELKTQQELV
ncbi:nonstructural protein [Microviridae sp.]|nr:nonstructural protein [Microviridae sp.]